MHTPTLPPHIYHLTQAAIGRGLFRADDASAYFRVAAIVKRAGMQATDPGALAEIERHYAAKAQAARLREVYQVRQGD